MVANNIHCLIADVLTDLEHQGRRSLISR